jgi:cytochrome c
MKGNDMRNVQWMTCTMLACAIYAGNTWAEDAAASAPAAAPAAGETVLSDAEGNALLKKNNCFACHAMDKKVVGPAFKDVAAKYRGQADAEENLVAKVSKGGKGVWGSMMMPPQAAKPDDVRAMVKFVLSPE